MAAKKSSTARQCRVRETAASGSGQVKGLESKAPAGSGQEAKPKGKPRLVKSLKARERQVEVAKSMVYGALPEIIQGIVEQAKGGNHNAVKFLLQFAGIKERAGAPAAKKAEARVAEAAPAVEESPEEAVESFYRKLGMPVPVLLPPDVSPVTKGDGMDEHWVVGLEGRVAAAGMESADGS